MASAKKLALAPGHEARWDAALKEHPNTDAYGRFTDIRKAARGASMAAASHGTAQTGAARDAHMHAAEMHGLAAHAARAAQAAGFLSTPTAESLAAAKSHMKEAARVQPREVTRAVRVTHVPPASTRDARGLRAMPRASVLTQLAGKHAGGVSSSIGGRLAVAAGSLRSDPFHSPLGLGTATGISTGRLMRRSGLGGTPVGAATRAAQAPPMLKDVRGFGAWAKRDPRGVLSRIGAPPGAAPHAPKGAGGATASKPTPPTAGGAAPRTAPSPVARAKTATFRRRGRQGLDYIGTQQAPRRPGAVAGAKLSGHQQVRQQKAGKGATGWAIWRAKNKWRVK